MNSSPEADFDGAEDSRDDAWSDAPVAEVAARPTAEPTGAAAVDAVLDTLQSLDRLPIDEHPAVFENAHRALRHALDEPAGAQIGAVPTPPTGG